jgi:hypothetical protein
VTSLFISLYCSGLGGLKRLNWVSNDKNFNYLSNETKFSLFVHYVQVALLSKSRTLCLGMTENRGKFPLALGEF